MENNSKLNRAKSSFVIKIPPPLIQKLSYQNINEYEKSRLNEKPKYENI